MRIGVFQVAHATFYAPSEEAGIGGMHRQTIRCNPLWYGAYPRYDTVFVNVDSDAEGFRAMLVARVRLLFRFTYEEEEHACAYVEWFMTEDEAPDSVTGMWRVRPEVLNGQRVVGVISLDSIVRACHLLPVFGTTRLPSDFHFSSTLDAFRQYYVNRYIDYHAYETII